MIDPDLLDDLLAVASPADLLHAAAEIVAGEFPTPGPNPGPCANCGHSFSGVGSAGHRYEGEVRAGRCDGNGLDPCLARCERYVRPRPHLSRDLDRLAHHLRNAPPPTPTEETP